jgi:hypothetical protein
MGLTISLNRVSFLPPPSEIIFSMKLKRRVPDYTTPDWVHSLHEGAGPRFGEKPLKMMENLGLGPPYLRPLLRMSGSAPGLL